ncbi:unnamed protein product [Wickerhamomyces anomalus]
MVQPSEPEFEQAYNELVSTLKDSTLFQKHPKYERVVDVVSIPERIIQFRVTWENDKGEIQVNRGYRVQFNSALGPYKGGLRLHPSVNLSILKFLGFEQIFKNALTGLNIGGGKGGSDFNPKGKSDNEIRRFCYSFMRELSRHISQDTDVPAGDIGTGGREIGYLFGAYKLYKNSWEGVLTGKGLTWGGSLIRPEATGYGLVYYTEQQIKYATKGKEDFSGKRVAISGSGNTLKVLSFQKLVLPKNTSTLSKKLKVQFKSLSDIINEYSAFSASPVKYIDGARPWIHVGQVDVALPCATQNEVSGDEAKALVSAGAKYVAEGSNMGCTQEAIDVFEGERVATKSAASPAVWYGPGKASNAGGVLVSALEMAQNSQRITWTSEQVDGELHKRMIELFNQSIKFATEYSNESNKDALPSLVKGANLAGFVKVADAMFDHGDVY